MDLSASFRINRPRVIHETIDGEVVMIDFDTGNYYSLNKAGADIWGLISRGATLGETIEGVSSLYSGRGEVIEDGVSRLVAELKQEELIEPCAPGECELHVGPDRQLENPSDGDKPEFEAPALFKYNDMQDLLLLDPIHEVDESGWPSTKTDAPDGDG